MAAAETDSYLKLCAACGRMVRLTDAQAVIAEAELVALGVVPLAFCRRCREALP